MQILNRKLYESQALGQRVSFDRITGPRGEIFCENSWEAKGQSGSGEIKGLAINKSEWILAVNPANVADKHEFASSLEGVLGMDKKEIISKIDSAKSYVEIKKGVSSELLKQVKLLNLKGLYWQEIPERFYPQANLASHVLGFVGGNGTGQYGVEGFYEDILKGRPGIKEDERGLKSIISDNAVVSLDGSDIYLTIDYNIQFQAEQLLEKAKKNLDIEAGQIIVIKPDSGRIVALADYPSFDPNNYGKTPLESFQNSAVQKLFEPGSIMKPFTMAMAINEGKITPETTYVDAGVLNFGTKSIHNFASEKYGKQTMTQVLENSINTGAVFAEEQISHGTFFNYIYKFGFTQKTGIDLQGEVYSSNAHLEKENGPEINFATASFGQGIDLTPMQIVRGFSALANGGKLVRPYIVEKIANGQDEQYTKSQVSHNVISKETASQVNTMLINVVDKGFNKVAKIPGYYIAGKTGTAQVPLRNGKGYDENKTIQSFIGYAPAMDPQFLVLVKLDDPKVAKSALSAVPVFKELAQFIINYWQIPPDYDVTKK